jgi:hypothetical protein
MSVNIFKTDINELIGIFRESLYLLKSPLNKARIQWKNSDAYDGWDSICSCMFHNIVTRSIIHSLPDKFDFEEFEFKFSSIMGKYLDSIFICVDLKEVDTKLITSYNVFIDLFSEEDIFDFVRFVEVDINGDIIEESEQLIPFQEVKFSLKKITKNGVFSAENLNVQL